MALRHGHGIPGGGDGNMRCWATSEFVARTSGRPWKGEDILGNPRHGCCGSKPNNSKGASCRFRGKGVCDEQIMTALRHDDGTKVQVFGREGGGRNLGGSASRGGEQRRAMARWAAWRWSDPPAICPPGRNEDGGFFPWFWRWRGGKVGSRAGQTADPDYTSMSKSTSGPCTCAHDGIK